MAEITAALVMELRAKSGVGMMDCKKALQETDGDINAAIAPLSITADGLATLGIRPVATERSSKLYAAADVPRILSALTGVIASAQTRLNQARAA